MTVAAKQVVEQFKRLADADKREVVAAIVREAIVAPGQPHRKSVAEIPAFDPLPDPEAGLKPHDRDFADAILASKRLSPES